MLIRTSGTFLLLNLASISFQPMCSFLHTQQNALVEGAKLFAEKLWASGPANLISRCCNCLCAVPMVCFCLKMANIFTSEYCLRQRIYYATSMVLLLSLLFHLLFFINNLLFQTVQGTVKGYISKIILVKANDLK